MVEAAGLNDCLYAMSKLATLARHRPAVAASMCPGVEGSQAFNLCRSVLFILSVLPSNDFVELIGAIFNGPGAELCRSKSCGNAACTFASVDWLSSDSGGVKLLELLHSVQKLLHDDATFATTHRREVVNPHRRAVAAFIALVEPGHAYASALRGDGVCVLLPLKNTRDGYQRMPVVSTEAACATSVKESRFLDYNDMTKAAHPVPAASGMVFKPYFSALPAEEEKKAGGGGEDAVADADSAPEQAESTEPAVQAVASPSMKELYADLSTLGGHFELCMRLQRLSFMTEEPLPGTTYAAGKMFFSQCSAASACAEWLHNPVPGVKYIPGASSATCCGGGQESVGRLVGIAKQLHGTHYGDLSMISSGLCPGWDQLPSLEYTDAVHRENAGHRPYNGYTGPKALEKAYEFGLPYVTPELPGEVVMSPHESATHAHGLVAHLAQLCQPQLVLQLEWPAPSFNGATQWTACCKKIIDLAQVLGPSLLTALLRFNAISGVERQKALRTAFELLGAQSATESLYECVLAGGRAVNALVPESVLPRPDDRGGDREKRKEAALKASAEETRQLRSKACGAVLVAGLAMAIDSSIASAWEVELADYERMRAEKSWTMEYLVKNRCEQGGSRARAVGVLFGLWFDADAHNRTRSKSRTSAPFDHSEIKSVGAVDLRPAKEVDARIGFLRPLLETPTSKLVVLAGHTSVSLTEGHIIVLEMAARHILRAPGLCVSSASQADAWPACFPADEARQRPSFASVKKGIVVANRLFHNGDLACRTRKLVGMLAFEGGERFFYRSVQVDSAAQGEEKPRRKRGLGEACSEVDIGSCQFAPVYGADYSRRFREPGVLQGVAALEAGDEVIVTSYLRQNPDWPSDTAYREEVAHVILLGRGRHAECEAEDVTCGSLSDAGFLPMEAPPRSAEDGGRLVNPGIAGRAAAVSYTLSSEEGYVIEPLNALLSWIAWPIQKGTRSGVISMLMGPQGCGKSTLLEALDVTYGENMLRPVSKMEKEIQKQFGEECTNTLIIWGDEVSPDFIDKVVDSENMKEAATAPKSRAERKHENGRVKSDNYANYAACSNDPKQVLKRMRRLLRVLCSGGLTINLHDRPASDYFKAAHGEMINSPWGNAGALHFLCHYSMPESLEGFTIGSNSGSWTDAVLVPQPSNRLHKFLKWLVELPMQEHEPVVACLSFENRLCQPHISRAEFFEASTEGWGNKLCLSHADFISVVRVWYEFGVSRKERGLEKDVNAEVTIERQYREETGRVRTLMEMNQDAKTGTYELTRSGLRDFLRKDNGLDVGDAAPRPFYELELLELV
jgi:Family of unknown function (DUF5906)